MQGQGAQFKRFDTSVSPNAYVQVAGLIDLEDVSMSRGAVDTSLMDQTSSYMTSEAATLIDPGELSVTLEWAPSDAGQTNLQSDFESASNQSYQILYPDGTTFDFSGHITTWGKATPKEDRITRSVTLKISGAPTITTA